MKEQTQSKWMYQGKEVTADMIPSWAIGMVYRITRYKDMRAKEWDNRGFDGTTSITSPVPSSDMKIYIGKKLLNSTRKKKIGVQAQKKQLEETGDKRKVKKVTRVIKDSGWMTYNSSCKPLQEEIKEHPELFRKEILHWCYSKKQMTYYEMKEQFLNNVLETESYNDNIGGTLYRRDLIKPTEQS